MKLREAASGLLRAYHRFVSPALPAACRFEPSCSLYAAEAIAAHGVVRGGWFAIRRLSRCHPWSEGGFDPVPAPALEKRGRSRRDEP
jgi:hypothetical protein